MNKSVLMDVWLETRAVIRSVSTSTHTKWGMRLWVIADAITGYTNDHPGAPGAPGRHRFQAQKAHIESDQQAVQLPNRGGLERE